MKPFTEANLREPLRRLLAEREARRAPLGIGKAAAVLVPLFDRDGETHVVLTRRPESMRSHAGHVAFPGGKIDASDLSLRETALREAQEELGIDPETVDVLGVLDAALTLTGFAITPWVGWLAPEPVFTPNPAEVARTFTVPLHAFFEPQVGTFPRHGWSVDGEHVWGATAGILTEFAALLRGL